MHLGFSYIGLIYLILLFVPNIIWSKNQPKDYEKYVANESKILRVAERLGEVLTCCFVLIFSDYNIHTFSAWTLWQLASFLCMILYEVYWVRYFRSTKTMKDFYSSLLGVPVAGATLPVCAFLLLGIYGSSALLILATIILGIGHIGIHLNHYREINGDRKKQKLFIRIIKWGLCAGLAIILGAITIVIGCRNVNFIQHYKNIGKGVDEGIYIPICGQNQYILLRGENVNNPIIIYLHGGPSSPDSYCTYGFTDYLVDEYTVVCWDQRGCGRTYFENEKEDPDNATASFTQAVEDLDALVDYVCDRFGQDTVIIMGHSYGTILGSQYAFEHPEKVSSYIGVGQVVSLEKSDYYSYEDALDKAQRAGDSTEELVAAFERFQEDSSLSNMMQLRSLVSSYHPKDIAGNETWMAVTSPYFGIDDLRWFWKQIGSMEDYYQLNQQLFDYTFAVDMTDMGLKYQMPAYFISGSCDWVCPTDSIEEYLDAIEAPYKDFVIMEGCGHDPQYAMPEEFGSLVKQMLHQ